MALDVDTALTTVEDVRIALGLSSLTPDQTALVEKKIAAASAAVARYIGRPLGFKADIAEDVKGFGDGVRFMVDRTPVYEVTSIGFPHGQVIDLADGEAIIEKGGATGIISMRAGWVPFTGYIGGGIDAGRLADTEIAAPDLIAVVYSGGWKLPGQTGVPSDVEPLPANIQQAVEEAVVAGFVRTGRDTDVLSEKLMSDATTYAAVTTTTTTKGALAGFPLTAAGMLRSYKRIAMY